MIKVRQTAAPAANFMRDFRDSTPFAPYDLHLCVPLLTLSCNRSVPSTSPRFLEPLKQRHHVAAEFAAGRRTFDVIENACPGVSRYMVRLVLRAIKSERLIEPTGKGRGEKWKRISAGIYLSTAFLATSSKTDQ